MLQECLLKIVVLSVFILKVKNKFHDFSIFISFKTENNISYFFSDYLLDWIANDDIII